MKRLVLAAVCVSLLGGCATMQQPKITKAVHRHYHKAHVKTAAPKPAPVVAAPAPAPVAKPKGFFQRHPIQWLHH